MARGNRRGSPRTRLSCSRANQSPVTTIPSPPSPTTQLIDVVFATIEAEAEDLRSRPRGRLSGSPAKDSPLTAIPLMPSPTDQPKDVILRATGAEIIALRGWPRNRSTGSPVKESSVNANLTSPSPSAQPLATKFPAIEPGASSATIPTTSPEHTAPKNQVNQSTSYASMVDPDEGNSLDFIPAAKIIWAPRFFAPF